MQTSVNVGIYCRLSRDDGDSESQSISNQRDILTGFVNGRGWNLVDVYVDDGWSGSNFDRPDFKRMCDDIELGKINCVITKDLSRLGRLSSKMDYYCDEYFPLKNVRYLTADGAYDTEIESTKDVAGIYNWANERLIRDTSRKVKEVKIEGNKKGWFMGSQAPYGYIKSPVDKHVLIIDEEVVPIVKRVFAEFASGVNAREISSKLNNEGILSPQAHHNQRHNKPIENYTWGSNTVLQMIQKQVYIGNMVGNTRQSISYKLKERRVVPKEEWIVVENTHEAIIDLETWNKAQAWKADRSFVKETKHDTKPIFSGMVRCSDCGLAMSATKRAGKMTYRCGTYANKGKSVCEAHTIREEVLEAVVLNDIKTYANIAKLDKKRLVDEISKTLNAENAISGQYVEAQVNRNQSAINKINTTVKNLYEDKISGKLLEKFFYSMLKDYETELAKLEEKDKKLAKQLEIEKSKTYDVSRWASIVEKYLKLEQLTHQIAKELIDKIVVSAFYKKDGKRMQDVTIYYNFVGNLNPQKQLQDAV